MEREQNRKSGYSNIDLENYIDTLELTRSKEIKDGVIATTVAVIGLAGGITGFIINEPIVGILGLTVSAGMAKKAQKNFKPTRSGGSEEDF